MAPRTAVEVGAASAPAPSATWVSQATVSRRKGKEKAKEPQPGKKEDEDVIDEWLRDQRSVTFDPGSPLLHPAWPLLEEAPADEGAASPPALRQALVDGAF